MSRFHLGGLLATPGALALGVDLLPYIARHARGDWGELDAHDTRANEDALRTGARLLSAYNTQAGRLWIITDAADDDGKRACTTVLLPTEY